MHASAWFVAASTTGAFCAIVAFAVLVAGWRKQLAEVSILGSSLLVLSLLTTAHSLGNIDLAGAAPEGQLVALLALPAAILVALPLLCPGSGMGRFLAHHWRVWVSANTGLAILLSLTLVHSTAAPSTAAKTTVAVLAATATLLLVNRQVFLYRVGRRRSAIFTAIALVILAASAIIAGRSTPGSTWSWVMLVMENLGVLMASAAILSGYRTGRNVAEVLAPILSTEPLAALEVGLSPEVHGFVAALQRKDPVTRDHVVRTSALAMRVAIRAGLPPDAVRSVALGALLHDIGKLMIPSEIINKPQALTDLEFAEIKTHPEQGERLLDDAPSLVGAVPSVRWHHERVDGHGYPDGLAGEEVTLAIGLVSVCDAWDAMTHTRQYREGMGDERAIEILRHGAGTQWRADAVAYLLAEVNANGSSDLSKVRNIGQPRVSCCETLLPFESDDVCGGAVSADVASFASDRLGASRSPAHQHAQTKQQHRQAQRAQATPS